MFGKLEFKREKESFSEIVSQLNLILKLKIIITAMILLLFLLLLLKMCAKKKNKKLCSFVEIWTPNNKPFPHVIQLFFVLRNLCS